MGIIKKSRQEENDELSELNRRRGIYAFGRYIRMSADKARRVIDQIRGRSYEEALMILEFMPYRACYPIFKLIYSAAANARHNKGSNKTELMIRKVEVNKGTTIKKLKPRAKGRNYLIKRPTCHITIVLQDTFFMEEFRKNIHTFSKEDIQQVWAAVNSSTLRKFDDLLLRLLIKGELKLY
uniref:Large ribosomal subunit protein uL22c n=2 Tax=Opuntia TaxID=106975 RepID=A0AA96K962_9CARY|nr:ribosomal protein L22 [Brasiliopuntia brasiliensis]YP_010965430.1 ribosomal protein L22 [Miqueliopuntia miquelii]YP_010965594.1 ribosomal protein L22 [Opuntia auberi]YP_010965672.1 ribosomal protein L22 [Opuntia aureispina]YP_010965746.1 ribosomal protein L22 [Opuntia austrina]YP_010965826.1 ribosomal protein L22 [Opuntia caracassana]YP_010965904.1 ribosomal protein L22 [Opuntia chisosensis]YP_010965978.1 ribosomal protein L22 [Opuntia chlorotica]YP_010966138.1 ribosomal protein L22 [Opu